MLRALLFLGLGASLFAGQVDPRLVNLVGPDARMVTAVDYVRGGQSALIHFLPMGITSEVPPQGIERSIQVRNTSPDNPDPLTILVGSIASLPSDAGNRVRRLDHATVLVGDPQEVDHAARRWAGREAPGDLAPRVARLIDRYDCWFILRRPFEAFLLRDGTTTPSAEALELSRAVEEVSGGIRYGSMIELSFEVVLASADDAAALATLGRWLPAFVQMMPPNRPMARLSELAENFSIRQEGRSAVVSFRLSEQRMRALLEKLPKDDQ